MVSEMEEQKRSAEDLVVALIGFSKALSPQGKMEAEAKRQTTRLKEYIIDTTNTIDCG